MEGFEFSRVEKKKSNTADTGFEFACEDETASQFDMGLEDSISI